MKDLASYEFSSDVPPAVQENLQICRKKRGGENVKLKFFAEKSAGVFFHEGNLKEEEGRRTLSFVTRRKKQKKRR